MKYGNPKAIYQKEIAEEIKQALLKKCETPHQRNVVKETINRVLKGHTMEYQNLRK